MLVIACNPGMCLSALPMIEGLRTQSFKIYKEVHLDVAKVELKQPIVAAIAESSEKPALLTKYVRTQ